MLGSTPQLGRFRIRIVERESVLARTLLIVTDPDVSHLKLTLYADAFKEIQGQTSFVGTTSAAGQVWRIKGERLGPIYVLTGIDTVLQQMNIIASRLMTDGPYTPEAPPDPLVLFRFPNQVEAGANVYAFQKDFGHSLGEQANTWGFDVFYESLDDVEGGDEETTCM